MCIPPEQSVPTAFDIGIPRRSSTCSACSLISGSTRAKIFEVLALLQTDQGVICRNGKLFIGFAETISDMIIKTLDEVRQQTGEKYVLMFKEGKLLIDDYGKNNDVYKFSKHSLLRELPFLLLP